ncbi:hypothetical protein PMIN01_06835 [Paraphaeosphaeria minitans]|uniref:Uncharacterized protein n=1 Tax=Paraphaeosphaeria minitans TaxID=565426 RepID=A0A9P6KQS8_9PLEO|nr:hypothetical protein PMIN01_06835 [Paraphaeosphaeria minitans]
MRGRGASHAGTRYRSHCGEANPCSSLDNAIIFA